MWEEASRRGERVDLSLMRVKSSRGLQVCRPARQQPDGALLEERHFYFDGPTTQTRGTKPTQSKRTSQFDTLVGFAVKCAGQSNKAGVQARHSPDAQHLMVPRLGRATDGHLTSQRVPILSACITLGTTARHREVGPCPEEIGRG